MGIATIATIGAAVAVGAGGVEDAIGEYAEEHLYERSGTTHGRGAQTGMLIASALLLAGCFAMAHLGFSEGLEELPELFMFMLGGTALVIVFMEGMEAASAKRNRVKGGFSLWPVGLLPLIATTLFKVPFGSPGKTKLQRASSKKAAGVPALAKLFAALALLPVFVILLQGGFYYLGLIGGYTAVMLLFVDALPFHPLEGRRVFAWSKGIWLVVFVLAVVVLFAWQQALLDYEVFIMLGAVGWVGMVGALAMKTK